MHLKHALVPLVVGAAVIPTAVASASYGSGYGSPPPPHPPAHTTAKPTVTVRNTKYGKILFTGTGQALYLYSADKNGKSSCTGQCAHFWPPLIKHGKLTAGSGASKGKLSTIKRGSAREVTYGGHPLYTFLNDSKGAVTGQAAPVGGGTFYVVSPSGKAIK